MKPPEQLPLPVVRDWREPQIVQGRDLARVIADARRNGYAAHSMAKVGTASYVVKFNRAAAPGKESLNDSVKVGPRSTRGEFLRDNCQVASVSRQENEPRA